MHFGIQLLINDKPALNMGEKTMNKYLDDNVRRARLSVMCFKANTMQSSLITKQLTRAKISAMGFKVRAMNASTKQKRRSPAKLFNYAQKRKGGIIALPAGVMRQLGLDPGAWT